jgi:hypothetical protein
MLVVGTEPSRTAIRLNRIVAQQDQRQGSAASLDHVTTSLQNLKAQSPYQTDPIGALHIWWWNTGSTETAILH